MNNNILEMLINKQYQKLLDATSKKEDNLLYFYHEYASYKLGLDNTLFNILDKKDFTPEEKIEILDCLGIDDNKNIKILKNEFIKSNNLEEYDKNAYTDEEAWGIANSISFPKTNKQVKKNRLITSIIILALSVVLFLLAIVITFKESDETIFFNRIILLIAPSFMLAIGINIMFFDKSKVMLVILEGFAILFILSFICLYGRYPGGMLYKVGKCFFDVLKSIYNHIVYYVYKLGEDLINEA